MNAIALALGIWLGANLGVFIFALIHAAHHANDREEPL